MHGLWNALKAGTKISTQTLAETIVEKAQVHRTDGHDDDITVVAIQLRLPSHRFISESKKRYYDSKGGGAKSQCYIVKPCKYKKKGGEQSIPYIETGVFQ